MNTQTPEPTIILEQLEIIGRKHAVSHFEKGNFLDSPNEEVQKWLDRHHFTPIQGEFDRMFDAYCKGFTSYHAERWIVGLDLAGLADLRERLANAPQVGRDAPERVLWSDPSSLFSRMSAALRAASLELDHFHRTGQPTKSFMHSETMILGLGDLVAELNRIPTAGLSLVSPEPLGLLREAERTVKAYQKALAELFMGPYSCSEDKAEGLLTAQSIGAFTLSRLCDFLGKPEGRSSPPCAGSGAAVTDVPRGTGPQDYPSSAFFC